jgi:hypothetical protein
MVKYLLLTDRVEERNEDVNTNYEGRHLGYPDRDVYCHGLFSDDFHNIFLIMLDGNEFIDEKNRFPEQMPINPILSKLVPKCIYRGPIAIMQDTGMDVENEGMPTDITITFDEFCSKLTPDKWEPDMRGHLSSRISFQMKGVAIPISRFGRSMNEIEQDVWVSVRACEETYHEKMKVYGNMNTIWIGSPDSHILNAVLGQLKITETITTVSGNAPEMKGGSGGWMDALMKAAGGGLERMILLMMLSS